jgi:uncharacterized integral membrane protein
VRGFRAFHPVLRHDRIMAPSTRGTPEPQPEHTTSHLPPQDRPFPAGAPDYRAPAEQPAKAEPQRREKDVIHTRAGGWWSALIVGALVLVVLLVFILQNTNTQQIKVLFWEWNMPLGVALLGSAILGILLAACIGGIRIYQLRRAAKRHARR